MWHETEEEMMEMLKSIFRMDEDQSARRITQKYLEVVDPDYYEFESECSEFLACVIRKYKHGFVLRKILLELLNFPPCSKLFTCKESEEAKMFNYFLKLKFLGLIRDGCYQFCGLMPWGLARGCCNFFGQVLNFPPNWIIAVDSRRFCHSHHLPRFLFPFNETLTKETAFHTWCSHHVLDTTYETGFKKQNHFVQRGSA